MAMWRDPLDELIADLERAVPGALDPPGHDTVASMQEDHVYLCQHMQALLSRDPDPLRRAEPPARGGRPPLPARTGEPARAARPSSADANAPGTLKRFHQNLNTNRVVPAFG